MKIDLSRSLAACVLALVLPTCGFIHGTFHMGGASYSERDGVLYMDDTPLRFERWVKLDPPVPAGSALTLATPTGPVTLGGSPAPDTSLLEAHVFSEVENDGAIALDGGKLVVRSGAGHKVGINGIRGTVPPDCKLEIETGTGEVSLKALTGSTTVKIDSGTGGILLEGSVLSSVSLETGTGPMRLVDIRAGTFGVDTGTGDTRMTGCSADVLDFNSGTGDLDLDKCTFKRSTLESGTGDIRLSHGTSLGAESHDLGTGRLEVLPG